MAAKYAPLFSLLMAAKNPRVTVVPLRGGRCPFIPAAIDSSTLPFGFKQPSSSGGSPATSSHAPIDWKETPRAHVFKVDVPGLEKEEIKVEMEKDDLVLTISGEKKNTTVDEAAAENEDDNWFFRERSSENKFTRHFRLPENVKADEVAASLKNGVLTVTVPKAEPKKDNIKTVEISG